MDEAIALFWKIAAVLAVLNALVLLPLVSVPLYSGQKTVATAVYMLYSPTCHQYISRSYCFFESNSSWGFGDCIEGGAHPMVATAFTPSRMNYSGPFIFSRGEIGSNRADIVFYNDRIGFKMPVCARDFGIYLGSLLGMAVFLLFRGRIGPMGLPVYIIFLVPLLVDGFVQLLTGYESTNATRLATGLIAGGASGVALLSIIYPRKK
jgi:uncharacterized membrane protein